MRKFPLSRVYQLLEPGPVVLLATAQRGRANVMAMSWHMMMEFTPPLVGCIVSAGNHSFKALRATRDAVIAIPTVELAQIVAVGNCSGNEVTDKFAQVGLTPVPAAEVDAPLIAECWANLECRVVDTRMVAHFNMFVLEVVRAWHDPKRKTPRTVHHRGYGRFAVDGRVLTLRSRKP